MSPDKFGRSTGGQDSPSVSTIGGDLTITGNVTSKGEIHLDGHVHGDVHCVALVLGENSNVEGNVTAKDVVIRGRLIGSVQALRVTLQSESHVEGDLTYQSLAIEQGAFFDGKSRPSENPLSKSQTTAEDLTAIEPLPVAQSPEKHKKKPETAFVRSLPEPNEV
jgi:cytoskeletal protein CcmA (bactofilin family)